MDGIFIHAGWRTSGTWLWEKLRTAPGYHGFYEPLHEFLPTMDQATMGRLAPGAWASRHPKISKPYFAEFLPLHDGKGVTGAKTSFSFDGFFAAGPTELRDYINQLCDAAGPAKPVMKFARSQGRLAWFAAQFPHVEHIALIRQPWAQFTSGWRCFVEDKNPYFLAALCLVLERNLNQPEVAALVRALGLPIQPAAGADVVRRLKYWIRAVRLMAPAVLYRAHMAVWLLCTLAALPAANLVLDGDKDAASAAARFGLRYSAQERPPAASVPYPAGFSAADVRAAHDTALLVVAPRLSPSLLAWVEAAEAQAARDLAAAQRAEAAPTWRRAAWGLQAQMARWAE